MTPRRDSGLKAEMGAFSLAGTALDEAATLRRPKRRPRQVQLEPRPDAQARRPPNGARDRAIVMAERRLRGGLEAVVAAIIEAASSGDMAAARLVVDRLLPPRVIGVFHLRCGPSPAPTTPSRLRRTFSTPWPRDRSRRPKPRRSRNCCIISSRRASCASSNAGWRRSRRRPRNAHESARPPLEAPRSARALWPWAR